MKRGPILLIASALLASCNRVVPARTDSATTAPSSLGTAKCSEAQIGRYAIVQSQQPERDIILLDTATGQTWGRVRVNGAGKKSVVWEPIPRLSLPK